MTRRAHATVLAPVSADTCPLCRADHAHLDEHWACPRHGHKLKFYRAEGDWEQHRCPSSRCGYARSAPRQPRNPAKGDPMTAVETRPSVAVDKMWARERHIQAILPDHIDAKSFIGTAVAALYADPVLMQGAETSPETLIAALMECASLGHRPGTDEYYLVPRKIKNKPTVQGIEGYRGIIERMYRSGAVASVIVREVCAKDQFRYIEGVDDVPRHSIAGQSPPAGQIGTGADFFGANGSADRGPMVGVYAYAKLTGGAVSRVVLLSRDDVMKAKESSDGSSSEYSPWKKHERAMWWKTAARRLEPWVPTSAEYRMTEARATAQAATASQVAAPPAGEIPAGGNTHAALPPGKPADPQTADAIGQQIGMEFDRLSLDDTEERTVWVNKLAGKDPGAPLAQLTQADLMKALRSLESCDDTAELHALAGES